MGPGPTYPPQNLDSVVGSAGQVIEADVARSSLQLDSPVRRIEIRQTYEIPEDGSGFDPPQAAIGHARCHVFDGFARQALSASSALAFRYVYSKTWHRLRFEARNHGWQCHETSVGFAAVESHCPQVTCRGRVHLRVHSSLAEGLDAGGTGLPCSAVSADLALS